MGYELATSVNDVREYLRQGNSAKEVGLDTEATSLNTRLARLVGLSFSFEAGSGMYVPLAHQIGTNVPWKNVIEELQALEEDGYNFVFYNTKYDKNVLQRNTQWAPKKHLDALELVYLADPDRLTKGLKEVAKEVGMDMTKFEDLFTPEEQKAGIYDISTKSPARCVTYAASDADATLRVKRKYQHIIDEFNFAVTIDTKLVDIIRKIEHNGGMLLNEDYIDEQIKALIKRKLALEEQVHRIAKTKFDIDSPKQLGTVLFDRMGIKSPGRTMSGGHKTGAEDLEKLAKAHPIMEYVISYRKVAKAESTYFKKLKNLAQMKIPVRFQFNIYSAPTFRFAAPGGSPLKDGATGINIQAVSNGESREMYGVNLTVKGGSDEYLEGLDNEDLLIAANDEEVNEAPMEWHGKKADLPWVVENEGNPADLICFRESCAGCPANCKAEGIDTTRRLEKDLRLVPSVRQAFKAPDGYTLVSFDYDRQELVIGANMSGERRWLTALAANTDLHVSTAAAAFGIPIDAFMKLPKFEYKRKRDVGKTLNFATFYGATAYTLARKADISQAQADQIYEGFVRNHPQLFAWMQKVHMFARREGYTTTYFGRKRWLKRFYEGGDRKMAAFGDRSAVNTAIQGTAAEVTRIAMVKVQAAFEKANITTDMAKFVMQVHDELMFIVRNDCMKLVCPIIKAGMEFKVKSWEVQLSAGMKHGQVWGIQQEVKDFNKWLEAA